MCIRDRLEAACTAAEVGCTTFLLEKKDVLGGLATEISKIPDKKRLYDFPKYLINRAEKLENLYIFKNTEATVDLVKSLKPSLIVNATGSSPLLPPIKMCIRDRFYNRITIFTYTCI